MINFTINSTDPKHFNVVHVTLPNMTHWNHATLTVSSLVANCHILVLERGDFINFELEGNIIEIIIQEDFTTIQSAEGFASILTPYLLHTGLSVVALSTNLIEFKHPGKNFSITEMSYNIKMLSGFYCVKDFPIYSEQFCITAEAVGFFISTPILYLISSLGDINVHNSLTEGNRIDSNTVCMRIQNSFTPLMPLITSNADFIKKINIGAITNFEVKLVDANLHDVRLLTPMWVTFSIQDSPPDEKDAEDFWQFNYLRQPREPKTPSQLIPLSPQLMEVLNSEPLNFS